MPSMLPDGLENEEPRLAIARLIEEIRRLWLALQGGGDVGNAPDGTVASEPTAASGAGELQWSAILGKPDLFPPTAHSHAWATDITGIPSEFPSSWSLVSGKPSTFTPSAHTHGVANITGMTVKSVMVSDGSGTGSVLSPTALLPSTLMWDGGDLTWNADLAYNDAASLFYFTQSVVIAGGNDILFAGNPDGTLAAADASAIGWNYSSDRRASIGLYSGQIMLRDGVGATPDGVIPLAYKPSDTDSLRELEFRCKVDLPDTWEIDGSPPSDGQVPYFDGTQMAWIDVVKGGYTRIVLTGSGSSSLPAGTQEAVVICVGGGGAGTSYTTSTYYIASSSGGSPTTSLFVKFPRPGWGGEVAVKTVSVSTLSFTYSVGSGGTSGGDGGDTTCTVSGNTVFAGGGTGGGKSKLPTTMDAYGYDWACPEAWPQRGWEARPSSASADVDFLGGVPPVTTANVSGVPYGKGGNSTTFGESGVGGCVILLYR